MLNLITIPTGIDVSIQKLQTLIHNNLIDKWGINPAQYQSYGRCYRNKKDNGYIAEVYLGNGEYKEVYWDDNLSAISFFGIGNTIKYEAVQKADVHLVFFVNLRNLKSALSNRADEEVRIDVINSCNFGMYNFRYTSIETSIETVLKEYTGSYRENRLKLVDMHPIHCFRINFSLQYQF